MIIGIGTDIVQINRITKILQRYGDKFANKILTTQEFKLYQTSKTKQFFLAKRFVAKEAIVKALGTGFRDNITLKSIEITNDKYGKPIPKLLTIPTTLINTSYNLHLSISDEKNAAIAFAILEQTTKQHDS